MAVLSSSASRFIELLESDLWKRHATTNNAQKQDYGTQIRSKSIEDKIIKPPPKYNSLDVRLMLWKSALSIFRDYPIFGIGPGGYNLALKNYAPAKLLKFEKWKIERNYLNAHNGLMNVLAEFGAAGIILGLLVISYLLILMVQNHGLFPPAISHTVLLGLFLSFIPDAFFYNRFYMILSITLFLLFTFQPREISLCIPTEK